MNFHFSLELSSCTVFSALLLKDVSMPFAPASCLIFLVYHTSSPRILPHSIGRHFFGMSPSYHLLEIDEYLEEEGRTIGYSRWG
jgi:hypothetical protein